MTFADQLAADGLALSDPAMVGELVTYYPAGAASRQIRAVVDRKPADGRGELELNVFVPKDATLGVTSVAVRADRIGLPIVIGAADSILRVSQILSQDEGGWLLRLKVRQVK